MGKWISVWSMRLRDIFVELLIEEKELVFAFLFRVLRNFFL